MNSFSWVSVFRLSSASCDASSPAPAMSFSSPAMAWAIVMAASVDQCWSVTISSAFSGWLLAGSTSRLSSTRTPLSRSAVITSSAMRAE